MNRIALCAALVLGSLLAAAPALAIDNAACCVQSTSKVDAIFNPARGSDEKFFGRAGGPPNILFILDNSGSMEGGGDDPSGAWPAQWPNTKGCGWSAINNLGYSKNVNYPKMKGSVTASNPDVDDWFPRDKFFNAPENGYGNNFKKAPWDTSSGNLGTKYDSVDAACGAPIPAADLADCKSCVQNSGYYIAEVSESVTNGRMTNWNNPGAENSLTWMMYNPSRRKLDPSATFAFQQGWNCPDDHHCDDCANWADVPSTDWKINWDAGADGVDQLEFTNPNLNGPGGTAICARMKSGKVLGTDRRVSGNFLNFYAPRDSGAVSVLTNIVSDLKEVRFALHTLNRNTPSENCFWYDDGGCIVNKIGPSCAKSYPWDQSSCDSNRNSILSSLTGSIKFNSGTPLTGALYSAGYFFATHDGTGANPTAGYSSAWSTNSTFEDSSSVCWSCGFNAIILLSDGEPNTEKTIPDAMKAMTGCGNYPAEIGGGANRACQVAKYLWTSDIRSDMTGQQKVATYTIGFSINAAFSTTLQAIANQGGGSFYPATSTQDLREAILLIIEDIARRNTAFSTSNIASVQNGQSSMAAIMPRMMPMSGKPWTGDLYRFELHNEFVLDQDKNGDTDKDDVFVVDKDGDIVIEASDGAFKKKNSPATDANPHWEARDRIINNLKWNNRKIYTIVDKVDRNDAATKDGLLTEHDGKGGGLIAFHPDNWQLLMDYMGLRGTGMCPVGKLAGEQGAFLEKLRVPVDTAAAAVGYTFPTGTGRPNQADYDELCAKVIINYIRGQDIDDENSLNGRTDTRESVLGDIFHSSPIVVDPPPDKYMCDLALHNQCVRTLYSDMLPIKATELIKTTEEHCSGTGNVQYDAYEVYQWKNRKRDKVVLVGANDGMLHAFHAGANVETEANACSTGLYTPKYDAGTGDEIWAFIPPDALPRLADVVLSHQFYVDGDIMVRDIWADGSGTTASLDGKKQADEFHTIAIAAEGRGGTHYFALEVLWNDGGDGKSTVKDQPGFRWVYPQPCSAEAALFGKTLFSLSPKAPPIGPVLINKANTSGLEGIKRHGTATSDPTTIERWVAFLSGGWSPSLEKGRGIYMVDAWSGIVQDRDDNLWWKFDRLKDGVKYPSEEQGLPRQSLTHSIVAPVAMADYGPNDGAQLDGFFDTAVVGDTKGQVWVARFYKPGEWDTSDKIIKNWTGARTFEQDRQGVVNGTDEDTAITAAGAKSAYNDWPFYYVAELAMQPDNGALRAFIGSGDRYSILEDGVGKCRWDNPLPCAKLGCDEYKTIYKMKRMGVDYSKIENHWKDLQFEHGKLEIGSSSYNACGTATAGNKVVEASISESKINNCPGAGANYDPTRNMTVECGRLDPTNVNNFLCKRTDTVAPTLYDITTSTETSSTYLASLGKNRFYGFWAYGGKPERKFDETKSTASTATVYSAKGFDEKRLSDRRITPAPANNNGDLMDVTDIACEVTGTCKFKASGTVTAGAASTDNGWFLEYIDGHKFRTATGAAVLASCSLWSNLYPLVSGESACANTVAKSRFYQGHYISGLPNCAWGMAGLTKNGTYKCTSSTDCLEGGTCTDGKCSTFARYKESPSLTPPPEPKVVVQISKTGQVKYSAMTPPEAGKEQVSSVDIAKGSDILQSVYELPVSRRMHKCRHEDGAHCAPVPP